MPSIRLMSMLNFHSDKFDVLVSIFRILVICKAKWKITWQVLFSGRVISCYWKLKTGFLLHKLRGKVLETFLLLCNSVETKLALSTPFDSLLSWQFAIENRARIAFISVSMFLKLIRLSYHLFSRGKKWIQAWNSVLMFQGIFKGLRGTSVFFQISCC